MGILDRLFNLVGKRGGSRANDDAFVARFSGSDAEARVAMIGPLIENYLTDYFQDPPEVIEDLIIDSLVGDPSPRVREVLLAELADKLTYWWDTPGGDLRIKLLLRLREAIPASLALAVPGDSASYSAGLFIGKFGELRQVHAVDAAHAESIEFRTALLDGAGYRDSDADAEAILRHLLTDSDPEIRAGAAELLEMWE